MVDRVRHVLLVEDEDALRSAIALRLATDGFAVDEAPTGEAAIDRLSSFAYDALVTDLRLPGLDGSRVLDAALDRYPDIAAIVVTGYGTVKDAVEAIRRGAADFITKPFQYDELRHVLQTALERRELRAENRYLREQLDARYGVEGLVGRSAAMRDLLALISTVAPTSSTILITGETGTGKEVVARAIHQASPRKQQRFIALNCSAIPETLLEAELFGHVRGAFTGALAQRQGRFEQAHRGTLLLDEVGTMSPSLQAKLLRVLQERAFERVGDSNTIRVDVRVIAATNSDLPRMVRDGRFREDLYYRLNVIHVNIPALRERPEDIGPMAQFFVEHYNRKFKRQMLGVSPEALRLLLSYDWPGNVRELRNAMERAMILEDTSYITPASLPLTIGTGAGAAAAPALPSRRPPAGAADEALSLEENERRLLVSALERTHGNQTQAARLLRITRDTLRYKMKKFDLR